MVTTLGLRPTLGGPSLLPTSSWDSLSSSQLTHFAFHGPITGLGWCGTGLRFKHTLGPWRDLFWALVDASGQGAERP